MIPVGERLELDLFANVVDLEMCVRRSLDQVQKRLVYQIATELQGILKPKGSSFALNCLEGRSESG
jgi:GTP cyclohydrolase I